MCNWKYETKETNKLKIEIIAEMERSREKDKKWEPSNLRRWR